MSATSMGTSPGWNPPGAGRASTRTSHGGRGGPRSQAHAGGRPTLRPSRARPRRRTAWAGAGSRAGTPRPRHATVPGGTLRRARDLRRSRQVGVCSRRDQRQPRQQRGSEACSSVRNRSTTTGDVSSQPSCELAQHAAPGDVGGRSSERLARRLGQPKSTPGQDLASRRVLPMPASPRSTTARTCPARAASSRLRASRAPRRGRRSGWCSAAGMRPVVRPAAPTAHAWTGLAFPLTKNGSSSVGLEMRCRTRPRRRGREISPRWCLRHQARGEVHGVAHHRVGAPVRRTDVAREHAPAVDADAHTGSAVRPRRSGAAARSIRSSSSPTARGRARGQDELAAVGVDVGAEEADAVLVARRLHVAHQLVELAGDDDRALALGSARRCRRSAGSPTATCAVLGLRRRPQQMVADRSTRDARSISRSLGRPARHATRPTGAVLRRRAAGSPGALGVADASAAAAARPISGLTTISPASAVPSIADDRSPPGPGRRGARGASRRRGRSETCRCAGADRHPQRHAPPGVWSRPTSRRAPAHADAARAARRPRAPRASRRTAAAARRRRT